MHRNLLQYGGSRYLWVVLLLLALCIAIYLTQDSTLPPNGGSWQGYTLGGISAALIVWLSILGIRKRSYRSSMGTVQGWTSAHVYLGSGVAVIATLHSSFQVGLNVHTLAYVLMLAVVVSGLFGLYMYLSYPRQLVRVRSGRRRKEWLTELNEIDSRIHDLAQRCNVQTRAVVESALDRTLLGGGLIAQLRGADRSMVLQPEAGDSASKLVRNADQSIVIDHLASAVPMAGKREETLVLQELLGFFGRRRTVLGRLRRDISLNSRMQIWLFVHVPLTVALLAALVVHVITVFLYW